MTKERDTSEAFERGLQTRRAVLGDAYVDKALDAADDFNWPMQQLTTEYCWDRIWNRPGLDRRSRSILNLGMIAALNRSHEFKAHIRGALANGLTRDELREILLQIAVYVGVPAGVDSFRLAREVFAEIDAAA
jgi:4-carboxymuconolactone decarboxylase